MENTVHVNVGSGYDVTIGQGLLKTCGERLKALMGACHAAVIADSNVSALYLRSVRESLLAAGFEVSTVSFPAGESSKNLKTLSFILEALAEKQLTRADCVVALGGGVTGDMAGFAAGVYLRGIRFVQLPTTLLAAVDSSVGGKTAVDLRAGKNLAGVFHQPCAVLCDTDTLLTLEPAVFADGMAEAVKTGILSGEALFSRFECGLSRDDLPQIIADCVAHKAAVVESDERETGPRRLLNLGHTAAHAIERLSDYQFPHGHAVAVGTAIIARAAAKLGCCPAPCAVRIEQALVKNALPVVSPFSAGELAQAALMDKKRAGGSITLVIARGIGDCILKTVPVGELEGIFAAGMEALT